MRDLIKSKTPGVTARERRYPTLVSITVLRSRFASAQLEQHSRVVVTVRGPTWTARFNLISAVSIVDYPD